MPAESVFVRHVVIGLRVERGIRSGGFPYPVLTNDAGSVPDAAGKIELAELYLVAGPEIEPAAHIGFAGRHEIHMVGAKLKRARQVALKKLRQPRMSGMGNGAADEVEVCGAIHG